MASKSKDRSLDSREDAASEARSEPAEGNTADERREHIAVAAYYNAERRGFGAGGETDDWLEAESQIDGRASEKGKRGEASVKQSGVGNAESGNAQAEASLGSAADRADFPDLDNTAVEHIEPDKVTAWAKRLRVPAPKLREAIQRVGPVVSDVKKFLETHAD